MSRVNKKSKPESAIAVANRGAEEPPPKTAIAGYHYLNISICVLYMQHIKVKPNSD